MELLRIRGDRRLEGRVAISGSKNAAMPVMAAALLTDQPVELRNVPDIEWRAVAAGAAAALVVAWLVAALAQRAAPTFGLVAPLIGIVCGAFLAGKAAKRANARFAAFPLQKIG